MYAGTTRFLRVMAACLAASWFVHTAGADLLEVTVKRKEPVITKQVFDPKRPSPKMPRLTPPESGVCDFDFEIDTGLGYSISPSDSTTVKITIDAVDIITSLVVRIWTARGSPPKLQAHEQGHQALCEYYYQNADLIARKAAEPLIGRSFVGSGGNRKAAEDNAVQQALALIASEYMDNTRVRCSAAQQRYDRLTRHGLATLDEKEAIAQVVQEDPEPPRESRPAAAKPAPAR